MTKDIVVHMEIPLLADQLVSTPALIFASWLPEKENEFITVDDEIGVLKLWFDRRCWSSSGRGHAVSEHINVLVSKIYADVMIADLSDDLVAYIKLTADQPHPPNDPYKQEYLELGRKVYLLTAKYLNKLIGYVHSEKGQYWLREYPIDWVNSLHTINNKWEAKVSIESEWFRWYPDNRQSISSRNDGCDDEVRFIDRETWNDIQGFIVSQKKPQSIWVLLANAEMLAIIGHHRSAITEAVAALEAAVESFSNNPASENAFGALRSERMKANSLKKNLDHLGFRNTVLYLFPIIFDEETMPTEVLKTCQDAIETRNNVIHNMMRSIDYTKLWAYLQAIRQMCHILDSYTSKKEIP